MIILNVSSYKTGGTWLQNILNVGTINHPLVVNSDKLGEINADKEYFHLPIQFGSPENFKKLNHSIGLSKLEIEINILDKVHFYSNKNDLTAMLADSGIQFIYMERDYRDVIVSRFYHELVGNKTTNDFTDFFTNKGKKFLTEAYNYNKFWFELKEHSPNVLQIKYEDLKNSYNKELGRLNEFLGDTVFDVEKVLHLNNINNNRKFHTSEWMSVFSSAGGDFYRKGIVGDYKNYFSEIQLKEFDAWLEELKD